MKESSRKALKITITILLMVSVLSCSYSVFAVDPTPTPTVDPGLVFDPLMELNYRAAMQIIYNCLNAWGIEIEYKGYREFGDQINDIILNWVIEFLDTLPSQYTVSQWIAPWQAGYDYWGNSRYNESALDDIQEFVQWLTTKLGLTDNSTIVVDPIYSMNGYTVYEFGKYYRLYNEDGSVSDTYYSIHFDELNNGTPIGFITNREGPGSYGIVALFNYRESSSIYWTYQKYNIENNQTLTASANFVGAVGGPSSGGIYWRKYPSILNQKLGGNNPEFTWQQVDSFMANAVVTQDGDTKILTSQIILPIEDPTYQPGDGITIIDGQPSYDVVTFSGEVTNLPAIVSTGIVDNPEIEQIYTNVPAFVETASDSMNVIKQIVFRMPDEVLITLYALLAVGVIFGFLRIMREH